MRFMFILLPSAFPMCGRSSEAADACRIPQAFRGLSPWPGFDQSALVLASGPSVMVTPAKGAEASGLPKISRVAAIPAMPAS